MFIILETEGLRLTCFHGKIKVKKVKQKIDDFPFTLVAQNFFLRYKL